MDDWELDEEELLELQREQYEQDHADEYEALAELEREEANREEPAPKRRLNYEEKRPQPSPPKSAGRSHTPPEAFSGFENLSDYESSQGSDRKKRRTEPPPTTNSNPPPRAPSPPHSTTDAPSHQKRSSKIHTIPPAGHHTGVTGTDGTRVYLTIKTEGRRQPLPIRGRRQGDETKGLLEKPIDSLIDQVEAEMIAEAINDSERIQNNLRRTLDDLNAQYNEDEDSGDVPRKDRKPQTKLWVDKYSPRQYQELLSDEGINRECLRWLKAWDECVFGKKPKVQDKKPQPQTHGFYQNNTMWEIKKVMGPETEKDLLGRPFRKVLLLCGPPGLGKTTLAHILARHCGYRPVEMNASDDRTPEVFKTRIHAATEMQSVNMADGKPNCLIIDEIDGANAPAIQALVGIVTAEKPEKRKAEGEEGGEKKKRAPKRLTRPIVCICNDQYVPALRPLRQIAHVVQLNQTSSHLLSARLAAICKREKLNADTRSLNAVCELTDNDVRAALNCLQFLRRKTHTLTVELVHKSAVGVKDKSASLPKVLEEVFHRPLKAYVPAFHRKKSGEEEGGAAKKLTQEEKVLLLINQNQEYDRIIKGCHEHYTSVRMIDPEMRPYVHVLDWLLFYDYLDSHRAQQHFSALAYMPYPILAFHHHLAVPAKTKMQAYTTTQFELDQKRNQSRSILDALSNRHTVHRSASVLALELAPYLSIIASPDIRPVSAELLNARERRQLQELIDVFVSYNLSYVLTQADTQYVYALHPNLTQLVMIDDPAGNGKNRFSKLTEATKQYIAHQVNLERVRRAAKGKLGPETEATEEGKSKQGAAKSCPTPLAPKPIQENTAKPKPLNPKVGKDFFAQFRKSAVAARNTSGEDPHTDLNGTTPAHGVSDLSEENIVWYKFNQGFTNAVRRPIKMRELMY